MLTISRERPITVDPEGEDVIREALARPIEVREKPAVRRVDPTSIPTWGMKPVVKQTKRITNAE